MDLAPNSPSAYCLGASIINTGNNSSGDSCSTKLHHADCMMNGTTSSSNSSSSSSIDASGCLLSDLNGTGAGGGGGFGGGGGSSCLMGSATSLPASTSPCPGFISDLLLHSDLDIPHNISNSNCNNNNNNNNSASSSPFNYDPFDGFPFLDTQHCMQPLFDHFVGSDLGADCDAGYNSGVDLFANNSIVCDRSDSVTSEPYSVVDIACHTIAAAAAAASATSNNNNIISITPDSLISASTTEHNNMNGSDLNIHSSYSCFNHSETTRCTSLGSLNDSINDIHNNNNNNSNNNSISNQLDNYRNFIHCTSNNNNSINDHHSINNSNNTYTSNNNNNFSNYNDCQLNYQTCPATGKRSVLMNLLIDGSDVGAGYTSHNCRALPQRITTQRIGDLN